MNRIVINSRVGRNGILELSLPVGAAEADREVRVTVEPIEGTTAREDEWRRAILETAGMWQGAFERPQQAEFENRDSLS